MMLRQLKDFILKILQLKKVHISKFDTSINDNGSQKIAYTLVIFHSVFIAKLP